MSGRYAKAPLVYMTARIKTTTLPNLTSDQWALVEQAMVKLHLPERVSGEVREVKVTVPAGTNQELISTTNTLPRYGFFSVDRSNSLILDQDGIEWRTSSYSRYVDLCQRIGSVLAALCETVDAYRFVPAQELSLSYVDFIAPLTSRNLSDYFAGSTSVLPLGMLKGAQGDLKNFGHVQVNRIIESNQRIFISLEELPTIEGKLGRLLPQSMMEPDDRFTMPLNLRDDWKEIPFSHYALLTTQAALLTSTQLKDLNFQDTCDPIHQLTRKTFKDLINKKVCDIDWEYIEDEN